MDELFRQLAFINAILGGFAITFLSVLITAPSVHRIVNWVVAVITLAAVCFILSALGATFSAVIASKVINGDLPESVLALHRVISLLFLAGVALLFSCLGMCGWMRSPRLGAATTIIAVLALIGGVFIMQPFIL